MGPDQTRYDASRPFASRVDAEYLLAETQRRIARDEWCPPQKDLDRDRHRELAPPAPTPVAGRWALTAEVGQESDCAAHHRGSTSTRPQSRCGRPFVSLLELARDDPCLALSAVLLRNDISVLVW